MFASPSLQRALPLLGTGLFASAALGAAWVAGSRREQKHSARLHRSLVDLLLNALSAGDPITERHSRRVANLTDALADAASLPRRDHTTLRVAALLHDMGKIDDRFFHIIHSRDALTADQRAEIKNHPHESAHILEPLEPTHPGITKIVASHHECWNGDGYPRGLAGQEIPLAARIITVADVFDALTQPRSYRDPLSMDEALDVLRQDAGRKFDPELIRLAESPAVRGRWEEIAREGREKEEDVQGQTGHEVKPHHRA